LGDPSKTLDVEGNGFSGKAGFRGELPRRSRFVLNSLLLAEKLIGEAVCFGLGPKVFREYIDTGVRDFVGPFPGVICLTTKYGNTSREETAESL